MSRFKKQLDFIASLSTVTRYSQANMCNPESVLEHSASVSLLSYFVANEIEKTGVRVNYGMLMEKAILHDADEVITGDIARPVKYHSEELRKLLSEMEHNNMMNVSKELCGELDIYHSWAHAKEDPEGLIVKFCDALSVVYKLRDEVLNRGNKTMIYLATNKSLDYLNQGILDIYYAYGIDKIDPPIDNPLIEIVTDCATIISQIKLLENRQ